MVFMDGFIILLMVCPVLGVDIPYCGDDQAKDVQFCTSKNDTMIDFNISPEDFHVNVTSLVRMFDVVKLDWTENTITMFLQIMVIWRDPRFKVKTQ